MTLHEVADLIVSPQAETLLRGNYVNKRGVRGYFVQIKCGNHWCKVSVSNADHHSARVTFSRASHSVSSPGESSPPDTFGRNSAPGNGPKRYSLCSFCTASASSAWHF